MELMMKIVIRDMWTAFIRYAPGAAAMGAAVMIAVHVLKCRASRPAAGNVIIPDKKKVNGSPCVP